MTRVRNIRIVRSDKLHKVRNGGALVDSGSACPSITLGDLVDSGPFLAGEDASDVAALITGGTGPYTPTLISGSLPAGTTLSSVLVGSDYYWILNGTLSFGLSNLMIGGTDANGCPITSKAYSVKVDGQFTGLGSGVTPTDDTLITVSGLPATYGTGVRLKTAEIFYLLTASPDGPGPILDNPTVEGEAILYGSNPVGDIVNAVIYDISAPYPAFGTGSSPYTGNWKSGASSFSEFNGFPVNGDWKMNGFNGDTFIVLTFEPI